MEVTGSCGLGFMLSLNYDSFDLIGGTCLYL